MNPPIRYSAAIPTMNRPAELRRCLDHLLRQQPPPEQILVIDDGSLDPAEVDRWLGPAAARLVYRRKAPPGSVASMNLAIELCESEWLLFLDDDIYLEEAFMTRMLEALERFDFNPCIAGVAGYPLCARREETRGRARLRAVIERLFLLRGRVEGRFLPSGFLTNYEEGWHPNEPYPVEHIPGGLGLWRAAALKKHQFDPWYTGYAAGQDQDLSYRISRKYELICQPSARALHGKSPNARTNRRALGEMRLRNQMFFFRRHFSRRPLAWPCFAWAVAGRLLLQFAASLASRDPAGRFDELLGMLAALRPRRGAKGGAA